jgi:hypothetical protein
MAVNSSWWTTKGTRFSLSHSEMHCGTEADHLRRPSAEQLAVALCESGEPENVQLYLMVISPPGAAPAAPFLCRRNAAPPEELVKTEARRSNALSRCGGATSTIGTRGAAYGRAPCTDEFGRLAGPLGLVAPIRYDEMESYS